MTNLKRLYYEDKEMQDIMIEFYQIKRNFIISILFLIQHKCILSRLSHERSEARHSRAII